MCHSPWNLLHPFLVSHAPLRGLCLHAVASRDRSDLAEHADLNTDAPPCSKQLRMPRRHGEDPSVQLTIQLTVSSMWHQPGMGGASDGDGSCRYSSAIDAEASPTAGGSSSSHASSALTHEALQALEASQQIQGVTSVLGGGAKANMRRAASFGRQDKARGAGKDLAGRVAELSQLVTSTAADARQAESRLATLQCRLRDEVRAPCHRG